MRYFNRHKYILKRFYKNLHRKQNVQKYTRKSEIENTLLKNLDILAF